MRKGITYQVERWSCDAFQLKQPPSLELLIELLRKTGRNAQNTPQAQTLGGYISYTDPDVQPGSRGLPGIFVRFEYKDIRRVRWYEADGEAQGHIFVKNGVFQITVG